MAGFLDELTTYYRLQLERHRNLPFLRGAMAASALIATIDGEISLSERMRVDQVVAALEALKVFDPHEAVDLFNAFAETIYATPREGREAALKCVLKVGKDKPETAELLIRVCLAVSESNGRISVSEQIELVTLCSLLDLDPAGFGLYRHPPDSEGVLSQVVLAGREPQDMD